MNNFKVGNQARVYYVVQIPPKEKVATYCEGVVCHVVGDCLIIDNMGMWVHYKQCEILPSSKKQTDISDEPSTIPDDVLGKLEIEIPKFDIGDHVISDYVDNLSGIVIEKLNDDIYRIASFEGFRFIAHAKRLTYFRYVTNISKKIDSEFKCNTCGSDDVQHVCGGITIESSDGPKFKVGDFVTYIGNKIHHCFDIGRIICVNKFTVKVINIVNKKPCGYLISDIRKINIKYEE